MNILVFLFLFLSFSCIAQEQKIVLVSQDEHKPIENARIIEVSISSHGYTDKDGVYFLKSKKMNDSIVFEIPGFHTYKTILGQVEDTIVLKSKYELLPEVSVLAIKNKKSLKKFTTETRKSYYTDFITSGGSIVSTFYPDSLNQSKIEALQFEFDNRNWGEKDVVYIRPLVFELAQNTIGDNLLDTPFSIRLDQESKNIVINISDSNIRLNDKKTYLIGFELIQRNKNDSEISFSSNSKKGFYSFLKKDPFSNWFKLDNQKLGFTLNYTVFYSTR